MTVTSYLPHRVGLDGRAGELTRLADQAALTGPAEVALMLQALPAAPETVIEIGCGSGEFVRFMRARLGGSVEGADPDVELLSEAPTGCCPLTPSWLSERAGTADLVVCRFVAQHLDTVGRAALWRQAHDLLKPGGVLAVIDVDDADFGEVRPYVAAVAPIYRKLALWQSAHGGGREVLTVTERELAQSGWTATRRWRSSVVRTGSQLRDLEIHLGPARHAGHVSRGALDMRDLAMLTAAWNYVLADPDAEARIAVHLLTARKPFNDGDRP